MYPHERSLVKQLSDQPFALIGVNSDQDLDEIRETVKEKNLTWRSFQNEQDYGAIADEWGIQGWPTIYVLDQEGKIRYKNARGDKMDQAIETLLSEMGHEVEIAHEEEDEEEETEEKAESDDSEDDESESDKGSEETQDDDKSDK